MGHQLRNAVLAVVAVFFAACGNEGNDSATAGFKVKTELLRVEGATFGLLPLVAPGPSDLVRYSWTSQIDIKSLKLPIVSITLSEASTGSSTQNPQTIYACSANCEVDLLGPALKNLLADSEGSISGTGTFQKISVSFGDGATDWTGKIKAEFKLGGKTYYTKATGSPTTVGPAEDAPYSGFGGGSVSYLADPLVISEEQDEATALTIKLYFDPLYAAYAVDRVQVNVAAFPEGFCAGANNSIRICTQRLVVTASTQAVAPTREHYVINESSLTTLYFDNGVTPIGGSMMSLFNESLPFYGMSGGVDTTEPGDHSALKNWSSGPLFALTKNADESYVVSSIVGEPNAANEDSGFKASAFLREDHDGKYVSWSGKEYDYSAIKQDKP